MHLTRSPTGEKMTNATTKCKSDVCERINRVKKKVGMTTMKTELSLVADIELPPHAAAAAAATTAALPTDANIAANLPPISPPLYSPPTTTHN
jgi:hypothetical protein